MESVKTSNTISGKMKTTIQQFSKVRSDTEPRNRRFFWQYSSFGNYGSLSIDLRFAYGPHLIVRSSVFKNNVSRYSVVINTVSDYEISPLHYYIWSGSFLDFSHAVSDQIQIRFSRLQFMKVRQSGRYVLLRSYTLF